MPQMRHSKDVRLPLYSFGGILFCLHVAALAGSGLRPSLFPPSLQGQWYATNTPSTEGKKRYIHELVSTAGRRSSRVRNESLKGESLTVCFVVYTKDTTCTYKKSIINHGYSWD